MRILVFGDSGGVSQLLEHIPLQYICGVVGAVNRPQYHDALRSIAKSHKIPFYVQPYFKAGSEYASFLKDIADLKVDLIWVNSYSMIIRPDVLQMSRRGGVNIHGAILPDYRGCNPMQWAIINNEKITGTTLHEISEGLDEGAIIAQKSVPLFFEDTWITLQKRIHDATDVMIQDSLPSILSSHYMPIKQDEKRAHYYRRRGKEDGVFSWDCRLLEIYNLIRALVRPHPGAFYINDDGDEVFISAYMSPTGLIRMKFQNDKEFLRYDWGQFVPQENGDFCIVNGDTGMEAGKVEFVEIDWNVGDMVFKIQCESSLDKGQVINSLLLYGKNEWGVNMKEALRDESVVK